MSDDFEIDNRPIPGAGPDPEDKLDVNATDVEKEEAYKRLMRMGNRGNRPAPKEVPVQKTSASYKELSYELSVASAKNRMSLSGNAEAALITTGSYLEMIDEYAGPKLIRNMLWEALENNMKASKCEGELIMLQAVFNTFFGFNAPPMDTSKTPGQTFAEYAYGELPSDLREQLERKGNEKAKTKMMGLLELYGDEMYNNLDDKSMSKEERYKLIAQAGANFGASLDSRKSNVYINPHGHPVIEYTDSVGKKVDLANLYDLSTVVNDALGKNMTNKGKPWPFKVKGYDMEIEKSAGPDTPGTPPGSGPDRGPASGDDTTPGPRSDSIPVPPIPPADDMDPSRRADIGALFVEAGITPAQFNELIAGLGKTVIQDEITVSNPDGSSSTSTVLFIEDTGNMLTRTDLTKDDMKALLDQLAADPATKDRIAMFAKANDVLKNQEGIISTCDMESADVAAALNAPGKEPKIAFDEDGMVVTGTSRPAFLEDVLAYFAVKDPERLLGLSGALEARAEALGIETEGKRMKELITAIVNEVNKDLNKAQEQNRVIEGVIDDAITYGAATVADRAKLRERLKDETELRTFLDDNREKIAAGKAVDYELLNNKDLEASRVEAHLRAPMYGALLRDIEKAILVRESNVQILLEKIEEYGLPEVDRRTLLTDKDAREAVMEQVEERERADKSPSRGSGIDVCDDLDKFIASLKGEVVEPKELSDSRTPPKRLENERKVGPTKF